VPIDITRMPTQVTYAGWRVNEVGIPSRITGDRESQQSALLEIQAFAKRLGLDARNVEFFVVKETLSFETISKTVFEITATTTPVDNG
jgi:hypothetical protein